MKQMTERGVGGERGGHRGEETKRLSLSFPLSLDPSIKSIATMIARGKHFVDCGGRTDYRGARNVTFIQGTN